MPSISLSSPGTVMPSESPPLVNYYQATGLVITPIVLRHTRAQRIFVPFRLQLPDPVRQSPDYVPIVWSCVAWGDVALWMTHHVQQCDQIAVQGFFRRRRLTVPLSGAMRHSVTTTDPDHPPASLPRGVWPLTTLQCRHITVLTAPSALD